MLLNHMLMCALDGGIDWFELDVGLNALLNNLGPHLLIMNTWWNIKLMLSH